MDERRLRRLLDAGRSLISELDREVVLQRLLEAARDVTGARYAAIGVLDEGREGLERFLTAGIDPETHRQIGDLPGGRGVLGVLINDPKPLRLHDVGAHPRSSPSARARCSTPARRRSHCATATSTSCRPSPACRSMSRAASARSRSRPTCTRTARS